MYQCRCTTSEARRKCLGRDLGSVAADARRASEAMRSGLRVTVFPERGEKTFRECDSFAPWGKHNPGPNREFRSAPLRVARHSRATASYRSTVKI